MTSAKRPLVVRRGWDGHVPCGRHRPLRHRALKADGYAVTVSDTLDSYLDTELLAATDLVMERWTMARSPARRRTA